MSSSAGYPKINRILHAAFALLMVGQLIGAEFMARPKPGRVRSEEQIAFFTAHEVLGIALLIVIGIRLTLLLGNDAEVRRLFPWFSADRLRGLLGELREFPAIFSGKLNPPGDDNLLAGAVHGLGLLLGLGLGLTGTLIFTGLARDGAQDPMIHAVMEFHEVLGELLLWYVIAHVGMALLHQLRGHRTLQRISPLSS